MIQRHASLSLTIRLAAPSVPHSELVTVLRRVIWEMKKHSCKNSMSKFILSGGKGGQCICILNDDGGKNTVI